ncbi:MAG: helix-turn-helix domain-containing protein [Blastocatellia bacterium]
MAKRKDDKMYTIREAAQVTGASESSIRVWLSDEAERAKRFPNARKESTPIGEYWVIPESDLRDYKNPGRGRPPKPKEEKEKAK